MNDPSAQLNPIGRILLSPTEMTIAPGSGWLLIQSIDIFLSYSRTTTDQFDGSGGNTIRWTTTSPSMGGTNPWVIARNLGAIVPEPSSLLMLGTGLLGLLALGHRGLPCGVARVQR